MAVSPRDLPWLEPQMRSLRQARAQQRFPHAIFIHAAPGCGGELLARFAAQSALCREPGAPCGQCRGCQWVAAGTHPDLHWIGLEEDSKQIRVQQIRELGATLAMTSHDGGAAVAVIQPADAMNENASNALLKTLEEPRPGVSMVLVAALPGRLKQTIRSRCLRLRVTPPSRAESLRWLQDERPSPHWPEVLEVLGNAPLTALEADAGALAQLRRETFAELEQVQSGRLDPSAVAANWARPAQFLQRMACAENWVTRQISPIWGENGDAVGGAPPRPLPAAGTATNIGRLVRLNDRVQELQRMADSPLNKSIGIEQLLWQVALDGRP
jgi:DNA polymerase-3 subunit delta'